MLCRPRQIPRGTLDPRYVPLFGQERPECLFRCIKRLTSTHETVLYDGDLCYSPGVCMFLAYINCNVGMRVLCLYPTPHQLLVVFRFGMIYSKTTLSSHPTCIRPSRTSVVVFGDSYTLPAERLRGNNGRAHGLGWGLCWSIQSIVHSLNPSQTLPVEIRALRQKSKLGADSSVYLQYLRPTQITQFP